MTRNTLTYLANKETERHNRATENQQADELRETISNNLRNYKINLSKNQIQRLANDQLNDRELQKLAETVRSNLADETERNRHNMSDEQIRQAQNVIAASEAVLNATKPSGKTFATQLLSWVAGNVNTHMYGKELLNMIGYEWDPEFNDNEPTSKRNRNYPITDGRSFISSSKYRGKASDYSGANAQGVSIRYPSDARRSNSYYSRKFKKEENEVPEDFSSSMGPGGKQNESFTNEVKGVKTHTSRVGSEDPKRNSEPTGAYNYNSDGYAHTREGESKVYYSPGARKEEKGPGIGIAFS